MFQWLTNFFGRTNEPQPDWPIEFRPLSEEKLKAGARIPAFLPYYDHLQNVDESQEMRTVYRRMLSDPNVKAAFLGKIISVMGLDLVVRPPKRFKKVERYQAVAEFVEWNLTEGIKGGLPGMVWHVLSGALIDGFSVCEKVWVVENRGRWRGKRVLRDLKPKDVNQDLVLEMDEFKNVHSIRGLRYNAGEHFDLKDFVIYSHLGLFSNPTGMSDFRAAYSRYWMLDTVLKVAAMGAQKKAFPVIAGEYPTPDKQSATEQQLAKIRYQNWLAIPAGVKLQVLDTAGRGPDVLDAFCRSMREEIALAIQGAVLSSMTGGEGQMRGDSTVHKDTADLFKWHLRAAVTSVMNDRDNGIVQDLCERNFAGLEEYPTAALSGVDEKELKESLDIDKGLQDMGWPLDIEELEEKYGRKYQFVAKHSLRKPQQASPGDAPPDLGDGGQPPPTDPEPGGNPDDRKTIDDDDPREKAGAMADILGGLYGDRALQMLDDGASAEKFDEGFTGTITDRLGRRIRYVSGKRVRIDKDDQEADETPRTRQERTQDREKAIKQAHASIQTVLEGDKSPETANNLLSHLATLTTKQLHELRRHHQLSASGRLKEQLVAKLADRMSRGRMLPKLKDTEEQPGTLKPGIQESAQQPVPQPMPAAAQRTAVKPPRGTVVPTDTIRQLYESALDPDFSYDHLDETMNELAKFSKKNLIDAAHKAFPDRYFFGSKQAILNQIRRNVSERRAFHDRFRAAQGKSSIAEPDRPSPVELPKLEKPAQAGAQAATAPKEEAKRPIEHTAVAKPLAVPLSHAQPLADFRKTAEIRGNEVYRNGQRLATYARPATASHVDRLHYNAVAQAVEAGKPVPAEVLKDYPGLAKQAAQNAPSQPLPPEKAAQAPPDQATAATPQPVQPNPVSQPTTPEAKAAVSKTDDTPRTVADRVDKAMDPDYEFARPSAVPNFGKDLKGSARHKANEWRGIEDAEKNGTAEAQVKRDNLLKAEPHSLLANITHTNALPSLASHLALNAFPAEPGKYPENYDKYRARRGYSLPPAKSPEELRSQYYDAYRTIKQAAEEAAANETDPRKTLEKIQEATLGLIRKFRGQTGTGLMAEAAAADPYNPVANSLVSLANKVQTRYRPKTNDVISRVKDFVGRTKANYPGDPTPEMLDKIKDHVSDVIEGDSFNKTFGTTAGGPKRFDPSEAYVLHAERKGGRVVDANTVENGKKFMLDNLGLSGVQWGNYVTDEERQHHLMKSSEALADLADVTGLPDNAISLGGKLGLGIGARGMAGARAHYEPAKQVINLTRNKGVGSLAHEWGHAMDHFMGGFEGFHSGKHSGQFRRPDPNDATTGAMQNVHKTFNDSGYMNRLRQEVRDRIRDGRLPKNAEAYWTSPEEMFARGFERHAQEKLHETGRENTYLVGLHKEGHPLWPNKQEMAAIGPAMQRLMEAVRAKHFSPPTKIDAANKFSEKSFDPSEARDESGKWTGGGSHATEREAAKLTKKAVGVQPMSQPRARNVEEGGEYGPNGEHYRAGAFIATQDLPKREKDKLEKASRGAVETAPGQRANPQPGQMSIYDKLRPGWYFNHRTNDFDRDAGPWQQASEHERETLENLRAKYVAGERWVNVADFPSLAGMRDVARLVVAGQPVPAEVMGQLPDDVRNVMQRYKPKRVAEPQEVEEAAADPIAHHPDDSVPLKTLKEADKS